MLALNEKAKSKPKKDIAVGVISVQEWGAQGTIHVFWVIVTI